MESVSAVNCADIFAARQRIASKVRRTPVVESPSLTDRLGVPVLLKLEHLQTTGSFKLRGASNAVACLSEAQKRAGVTAVSTGNHGRGLAFAGRAAGVRAIVCMSELAPQVKIDGIRACGAEVRIVGRSQDDAQIEVDRLVHDEGMVELSPFDDPLVIAGQGTLGLEIIEEISDVDTVVVQLSGGGLMAGVACAIKTCKPDTHIIGVTMDRGPGMVASLEAGKPVEVEERATLADALAGGIGLNNRYTFDMVREYMDDSVLLSEAEIAAGVHHAYWKERQIVEGSGGVCIAAALAGKIEPRGKTLLLLSGGNIDMNLHRQLIDGQVPDK
ncbi:MAG: hydroxyectoine utilization dehydratase EutB [Pseudomonadota bacterium]